jgi:hypothetical protein
MNSLIDFVGFQLGWFACVGGAAHGAAWLGPVATAALIAARLAYAPRRGREARRLAAVGLFGFVLESGAIACGLYGYAAGGPVWWLAPAWIVSLWVLLAATFESSLSWMNRRPWLAAAFGAVGSPLSFSAGVKMGAARFLIPTPVGLAALAALWAAALPLAFWISRLAGGEA